MHVIVGGGFTMNTQHEQWTGVWPWHVGCADADGRGGERPPPRVELGGGKWMPSHLTTNTPSPENDVFRWAGGTKTDAPWFENVYEMCRGGGGARGVQMSSVTPSGGAGAWGQSMIAAEQCLMTQEDGGGQVKTSPPNQHKHTLD